ncbi:MAG: glycosyltransferase family 9 protein [Chlorobi bacterium]|nr:glycosyltransferase family 9 protein [Chlorobiota bacterium]
MRIFRTIERYIRRATLALLHSKARSKSSLISLEMILSRDSNLRILLVRIDRIGDALISTPVIQQLRERFPESQIDILLGQKNQAISKLLPEVNTDYVLSRIPLAWFSLLRKLRSNRYDIVCNLHLKPSGSADLVSALVGRDYLIDRNSSGEDIVHEANLHVVEQTSLLLKPLGIQPILQKNEMAHRLNIAISRRHPLSTQTNTPVVALNVSVAGGLRQWPENFYVQLAEKLKRLHLTPLIIGAPFDKELIDHIASRAFVQALQPVSNLTSFAEALLPIDIIVTPDTSIVHLGAALRKSVVALYKSEVAGNTWRPWGTTYRSIINTGGMEKITPDDVLQAIKELIPVHSATSQVSFYGGKQ